MSTTSNKDKDKLVHLRVILKSGVEFTTVVKSYSVKWNNLNTLLTSLHVDGCVESYPVWVNLDEVAAIIRVLSNEERGETNEA